MRIVGTLFMIAMIVVIGNALTRFGSSSTESTGESPPPPAVVPASVAPTPVAPNRRDIESAVSSVISELRALKQGQRALSRPVTTATFFQNETLRRAFEEYANAESLVGRIDDIRGRVVDLSTSYELLSNQKSKLLFMRHDTWTFIHGWNGWLLDTMRVNDRVLTAFVLPNGQRVTIADSAYDATTGQVTFTNGGIRFAWRPQKDGGWQIYPLTTPEPSVQWAPAVPQPAVQPLPLPRIPQADAGCEEVSVTDVYDDGKILALDDGRHLRVADYDTSTSMTWVAPFDGLICDSGDRFIDKDDNEGVDLQP